MQASDNHYMKFIEDYNSRNKAFQNTTETVEDLPILTKQSGKYGPYLMKAIKFSILFLILITPFGTV